ncbi:MAG: gamma-glutamyltransferase [Candidatus Korarchaeum sp.]|nr:gamma-glutamyltransferase [Candidatus Korarchaeum sp.]MDW8035120.1 gamma-glutamyltransferase [Candidatus Korarchaeum sp.]
MRHPYMTYGGLVASEHYLASTIASEVLRDGGNAVDASVAASLSLSVLLPHLGGLGGDFFALVKMGNEVRFIDGSGPSPYELNREELLRRGFREMPAKGPLSITVPGYVDALHLMWRKYGRMSWSELVYKIVMIAKNGFPVSESLSNAVKLYRELLLADEGSASTYTRVGEQGSRQRFEGLASALERVAEDPRDFYEGEIASSLVKYIRERGGLLSLEDLSSYHASEGQPVIAHIWCCEAYEMPPPTQGVTTLHMLMFTDELGGPRSLERVRKLIEISRRAYAIRDKYITDPRYMSVSLDELIDPSMLEGTGATGSFSKEDTTFFSVIDSEGMMVAGIQSIFTAFGSGLTEPRYQVTLNCRGSSFSLDEGHVNKLEPGKRTMHTLSALLMSCGGNWYVIGTSGAHFRPQLHWWISTNLLKYEMGCQEALDFPRAYLDLSNNILVAEEGIEVSDNLNVNLKVEKYPSRLGVAALTLMRRDGLKVGCVDVRGDGGCSGTLY